MKPKPYTKIPIQDCGEPLVPIPNDRFSFVLPHPYQKLGAPYGDRSPFFLRAGVLEHLLQAQAELSKLRSGWRIQIFDAYRPISVQQFMVNYAFQELVRLQGLSLSELTPEQEQTLWEQVHQFWATPSLDPKMPPPHSTGAAVDITLVDEQNNPVPMGSEIDEISPRSHPHYFALDPDPQAQQYHASRRLLAQVMEAAGFRNHPQEWWHFSYGDQLWAWLGNPETGAIAYYGRVDLESP
jgi:D-alanyl-D-alanine dipeptidase